METWVACTDCGVSTDRIEGAYSERPAALLAWNRRAEGIGESRREPLTWAAWATEYANKHGSPPNGREVYEALAGITAEPQA